MTNSYIFITGATSGFGEATARLYAQNGFDLILTGRRKERLQILADDLVSKHSVKVEILTFDVRDFATCEASITSLNQSVLSNISVLVNNAGLAVGRNTIDDGLLEDWDRMIDTNLKGLLNVSKCIIPYMKSNKIGHIINIGSIAGKEVYPEGNVYCASKHAVNAISQAMRIDLLKYNIRVGHIAPGAAETEFSLVRFKGDESKAKAVYNGFTPLQAQDIAETIYFMTSRPSHVNINDLVIMPTAQASSQIFHK
ncbi:MAG: SDR family NAD(P)-dependent oxidoreductase [Bacteroidetes bacterium]|nr:SDR family NAD(P)-dependent oxidoreductase [Bacteroidota bacterium]